MRRRPSLAIRARSYCSTFSQHKRNTTSCLLRKSWSLRIGHVRTLDQSRSGYAIQKSTFNCRASLVVVEPADVPLGRRVNAPRSHGWRERRRGRVQRGAGCAEQAAARTGCRLAQRQPTRYQKLKVVGTTGCGEPIWKTAVCVGKASRLRPTLMACCDSLYITINW